ncbi:hypothetical protein EON80_17135, partial [bacterium]
MDHYHTGPVEPKPAKRVGPRILTALIGIPIVLFLLNWGGKPFAFFILVLALGAMRELQAAVAKSERMNGARIIGVIAYPSIFWAVWHGLSPNFAFELMVGLFALAVLFFGRATRLTLPSLAITLLATLYISLFSLLLALRMIHADVLYIMLFSVWASDTAAYYGGRKFGMTRLSPLSPGKTWEGMVCGGFAAIVVAMFLAQGGGLPPIMGISMGAIIAIFAPFGDLAES